MVKKFFLEVHIIPFEYAIESNLVKNEDENLCVFNIGTPQTQLIELPAC